MEYEFLRSIPGENVIYPYNLSRLQADVYKETGGYTIVNLTADVTAFEQEPFYVWVVYPSEHPTFNSAAEKLEKGLPTYNGELGKYYQTWTVVPLTPEEIQQYNLSNLPPPNWVGFYQSILISNIYQVVVAKGMQSGNTGLSTSIALLANALTEANNGRVNVNAIQSAMSLVLVNAQPSLVELQELYNLAEVNHLPQQLLDALQVFILSAGE